MPPYRLEASDPAGITVALPRRPGLVALTVAIVRPLHDMLVPLADLAGWDWCLYAPFDGLKYRAGFNYMELLLIQDGAVVARGADGTRLDERTFAFHVPAAGAVRCVFNDIYYSNNRGAVEVRVAPESSAPSSAASDSAPPKSSWSPAK